MGRAGRAPDVYFQVGDKKRFEKSKPLNVVHVQVCQQYIYEFEIRDINSIKTLDTRPGIEYNGGISF
jgi:hypothetical protein